MPDYVSLKEASRRFGYEVSTIRRWLKAGRVDGLKGPTDNSPWKVSVDSLERLLRQGARAGRREGGGLDDHRLTPATPEADARPLPELLRAWCDAVDARLSDREPRSLSALQRSEAMRSLDELRGWLHDLSAELEGVPEDG